MEWNWRCLGRRQHLMESLLLVEMEQGGQVGEVQVHHGELNELELHKIIRNSPGHAIVLGAQLKNVVVIVLWRKMRR